MAKRKRVRILHPASNITPERAVQLSTAVDNFFAKKRKEARLIVDYVVETPYKIAKKPYYDARRNQFFAKVHTNKGPRLVIASTIGDEGVVWAFATAWKGSYESMLPKGWRI